MSNSTKTSIDGLRWETRLLREELLFHPVYDMVDSMNGLRLFMEHHVFAVWDFMSLLKRLQQLQTCIDVPWTPRPGRIICRFINEIVLGEESDEDGDGSYISHFEIYREAMRGCGASTAKIDRLLATLARSSDLERALMKCSVEASVVQFVRTTWSFVESMKPHCILAAFTFGREDVIPEMFRRCVAGLSPDLQPGLERMKYYLARHIDLDENSHGPMALNAMRELCGEDAQRWSEATDAARIALQARIRLWDGIVASMRSFGDRAGAAQVSQTS
jgi:hypothetical protein